MEQLSLLQKIYLYGETLSSEELNQIVLYLNSSIEAINTLIARNNNINEGHCEMRYKVSAQLPEAPESSTDGKSNGWSDTYTRPDTANGEITWMTLSFFNGEGVYGAWSTPVCITWGSIRGQVGPKGESGLKGSFKSRVFKRLNSRPDTPTGGTYDNPIPPSGGWTDGIPSGAAIIWSSVCTFYGNGLSSGWSVPAPESDSDTLDIEFSPSAVQPEPPTGNTPFSNHESEGWYDPSSNQFNLVGTMIWRAERKVSNGEYNGDWTITRIVGEKGDRGDSGLTGGHYEFRYNNFTPSDQASAPTKPSDGSNGTTGGWTTSQETLTEQQIKDGTATWMTQCYQNENGTYGNWTDPIRITGANGYDGADGNEIEFVYTRNNTGETPAAPPTTLQEDWTGTVNGVTWTDNPLGVLEDMMYEYVSLRAKINDVWSDYSTPVIWSKWGEKGMDGDGYEYIYKRFSSPQTFTKANLEDATSGNPEDWPTNLDREYRGTNTGWTDDPTGIDEDYKYEYVSCRQRIDEVWGKFNKPTLWSGLPGVFLSRVFTRTNDDISNITPSGGTYINPIPNNTVVGSGQNQKTYVWSDGIPNGSAIIWSSTCIFNGDGTNNGWSKPLKESDTANLDIEFTDANSANGSAAPTAPLGSTPFSDHSSENPAWYDPSSIPANKTMVWRAERKVSNGVYDGNWVITRIKGEKGDPGTNGGNYEFRYKNAASATAPTAGTSGTTDGWSATLTSPNESDLKSGIYTWMTYCYKSYAGTYGTWSTPVRITGANGYEGADGSDIEFIYHRDSSATAPSAPTASHSSNSKVFSADDWYGKDSNGVEWTDNPSGVTSSEKYEFVAVREKPAGKNQSWGAYHVALWSKWGEKGMDGDGYEYIYKHFSTEQTWGADDNNPNNWAANSNREYYGPSGYEWSDDPTGVDSTNKYEYVSVRQRVDGTWQKFSTPVLWSNYAEALAAVPGPQGKLGPMSYLAGIWDASTTYTKTETKNPVVYYAPNDSYYYLVGTPPVSSLGDNPTSSDKWAQAENYNMVFTDILFVNQFAKLGSFIVNNDWLITRHGIIYDTSGTPHVINEVATWTNGNTTYNKDTAYTAFDADSPSSNKVGVINFVPNAAIDARTGESYFNKAHVKGEINATSGIFSGDVYANLFRAGNENGFNITVNSDSIDFNYGGSKQAWFTTKKYEMNPNGEIVDSGNDASQGFYLYIISPKNGNLVTIDFDDLKFSEVTNANLVLIPTHTTTIKTLTVGNGGLVSLSNKTIYYQNLDANGNSITKRYFWNPECTNEITSGSYLNNNCYVLSKTGFCIISETVTSGSSVIGDKALRDMEIYKPAYIPPNTGMLVGNGSSVYIVKKNNNYYAVRCTNTSSYTVYNSGVYYNANPSSPLSSMSSNLKLSSDNSGVSAYLGTYSGSSGIPTHITGAKLSVFTVSGANTPLTKVDYDA